MSIAILSYNCITQLHFCIKLTQVSIHYNYTYPCLWLMLPCLITRLVTKGPTLYLDPTVGPKFWGTKVSTLQGWNLLWPNLASIPRNLVSQAYPNSWFEHLGPVLVAANIWRPGLFLLISLCESCSCLGCQRVPPSASALVLASHYKVSALQDWLQPRFVVGFSH